MSQISRFFEDREFWCKCGRGECDAPRQPAPELLALLDEMREDVGAPVHVTSGLRCAWWNRREGGRPDSGHLDGTEADLRCAGSRFRYALLASALRHGVPRVGVAATFLHVGVSPRLDQQVVWVYPPPTAVGYSGC